MSMSAGSEVYLAKLTTPSMRFVGQCRQQNESSACYVLLCV